MHKEHIDTAAICEEMYALALKLIVAINQSHATALNIDLATYKRNPKPSVLVFLPGLNEIQEMFKRLECKFFPLNLKCQFEYACNCFLLYSI